MKASNKANFSRPHPIQSDCPHCGVAIDAATSEKNEELIPGSVTICIACAGIGIFDGGSTIRKPTDFEQAKLAHDPDVMRHVAAVRLVNRKHS